MILATVALSVPEMTDSRFSRSDFSIPLDVVENGIYCLQDRARHVRVTAH